MKIYLVYGEEFSHITLIERWFRSATAVVSNIVNEGPFIDRGIDLRFLTVAVFWQNKVVEWSQFISVTSRSHCNDMYIFRNLPGCFNK